VLTFPFLFSLLSPSLTAPRERPGRSRAFSGGFAGRRWRRRGAGVDIRFSFLVFGCMPVVWSRVQDLLDQILRSCVRGFVFSSSGGRRQRDSPPQGSSCIRSSSATPGFEMLGCHLFLLWPTMETRRIGRMVPAPAHLEVGRGLLQA
jgi:hypothetical protein